MSIKHNPIDSNALIKPNPKEMEAEAKQFADGMAQFHRLMGELMENQIQLDKQHRVLEAECRAIRFELNEIHKDVFKATNGINQRVDAGETYETLADRMARLEKVFAPISLERSICCTGEETPPLETSADEDFTEACKDNLV